MSFLEYASASGWQISVCRTCAGMMFTEDQLSHAHLENPSVEGLQILDEFYEQEALNQIMGIPEGSPPAST